MRTRVMNQLHVVALNEGLRRKKALWRQVAANWSRWCWLPGPADDDVTFSFQEDEKGNVSELIVHAFGRTFEVKKTS
jgi:hypothetical protein